MRPSVVIAILFAFGLATPHTVLAQPATAQVDWTGAYVGAHAGYGWGEANAAGPIFYGDTAGTSVLGTLPGFVYGTTGAFGGGEAGYNWSAAGILIGLQADLSAAHVAGTHTDSVSAYSLDQTLNWLSTARVQVGLPYDRLLLFGSAGLAVGGLRADLHDYYMAGTVNTSHETTSVGFVVGAGVAAALDQHWSVKAEYLHVDLGSHRYTFNEPAPRWPLIASEGKTTFDTLRVALDYRF